MSIPISSSSGRATPIQYSSQGVICRKLKKMTPLDLRMQWGSVNHNMQVNEADYRKIFQIFEEGRRHLRNKYIEAKKNDSNAHKQFVFLITAKSQEVEMQWLVDPRHSVDSGIEGDCDSSDHDIKSCPSKG